MLDPRHVAPTPESVGLDSALVDALFDRAEKEVREGLLPSAQIAIARNGKIAAMRTFGTARHHGVRGARDERDALLRVLVDQGDHVAPPRGS